MFENLSFEQIMEAFLETFFMTLTTGFFVLILGFLLGYSLYKTEEKKMFIYKIINIISSVARSIPFIILIILMLPVTNGLFNFIFGQDQRLLFNWQGAVPALVISATPFYARLVHHAFKEVSSGTKEMLNSIGATGKTTLRIITGEAMPSLVAGFTTTIVTLIGFSSAAAIIGAGGLGYLATRERNHFGYVIIATSLILLLVFLTQAIGDFAVRKINKR